VDSLSPTWIIASFRMPRRSDSDSQFCGAVGALHRSKDRVYGTAWKKRGEVLSILANVARKVDRLDGVASGIVPDATEVLLDTGVDLLIYCVKYEAFLADLDPRIEARLFSVSPPRKPYSEGTRGVEQILGELDLSGLRTLVSVSSAAAEVIRAFHTIELCFDGLSKREEPVERWAHLRDLTLASIVLIGAISNAYPHQLADFVSRHPARTNATS